MCSNTFYAGNPPAGFDVAGAGNQFTVRLVRHSQRKRGATDRSDLRSTAPVLDPTACSSLGAANRILGRSAGSTKWLCDGVVQRPETAAYVDTGSRNR